MPIYVYRCANGHEHEHICAIEERPDSVECECGEAAPNVPALVAVLGHEFNTGPQWDPSLNCMVRSESHRQEIMRKQGRVNMTVDDLERIHAKQNAEAERDLAAYTQQQDEYENHPKYRAYREARDKGAFAPPKLDKPSFTVPVRMTKKATTKLPAHAGK